MSVAFTKESDAEAVAANLPDRPIPSHANLVTPRGLAQIDSELAAARAAYDAARSSDAITTDRSAMAQATRDLRYWSARRATAQLIEARPADGKAAFVSFDRLDLNLSSASFYKLAPVVERGKSPLNTPYRCHRCPET